MLLRDRDWLVYGLNKDDAETVDRLAAIEQSIRHETHNNFQVRAARVVAPSVGGWIQGVSKYIVQGDTVEVSKSGVNDGLYVVIDIANGCMRLDGDLFDVPGNRVTLVRYPKDVVAGGVAILEYERKMAGKLGIASEGISRHNVSYIQPTGADGIMGYPASVTSFIKRHRKAMF